MRCGMVLNGGDRPGLAREQELADGRRRTRAAALSKTVYCRQPRPRYPPGSPYGRRLARQLAGHIDDHTQEADRIDVPFEQVLEGQFILGSPAECAAEVARYRDLGVAEIIVRCQWPGMPIEPTLQAIQRFGREVLPQL